MTLFNEQNRDEQIETALYFLCFESMREREMLHVDTDWTKRHFVLISQSEARLNYHYMVITVVVHEMD